MCTLWGVVVEYRKEETEHVIALWRIEKYDWFALSRSASTKDIILFQALFLIFHSHEREENILP